MVTAILPALTANGAAKASSERSEPDQAEDPGLHHDPAPSVSSQLTITPARHARSSASQSTTTPKEQDPIRSSSPPRLAGIVGLFTGCGALLALGIFLPLPTRFSKLKGVSAGQAVVDSYYVVGTIALIIAGLCFIGLRHLKGEEGKGWRRLIGGTNSLQSSSIANGTREGGNRKIGSTSYTRMFSSAVRLGFTDWDIGLSYLGGFVDR